MVCSKFESPPELHSPFHIAPNDEVRLLMVTSNMRPSGPVAVVAFACSTGGLTLKVSIVISESVGSHIAPALKRKTLLPGLKESPVRVGRSRVKTAMPISDHASLKSYE